MSYICSFAGCMHPDYWQGSSLPHCTISVHKSSRRHHIRDHLHWCLDNDCIDGIDHELTSEQYSAMSQAVKELEIKKEMPFFDVLDNDVDTNAYFVFETVGSNPCPDCGKELEEQKRGGVKCPDNKCGYWFCY